MNKAEGTDFNLQKHIRSLKNVLFCLLSLATSAPTMDANGSDDIQEPPLMSGLEFPAPAGLIEPPFIVESGVLSQTVQTYDPGPGGRARWRVVIPETGYYTVTASVNAPSTTENSFFIDWDKESYPVTWDISLTVGFEDRVARWPGEDPRIWELTKGVHTLIIRGREPAAAIRTIRIEKYTGDVGETRRQAKAIREVLERASNTRTYRVPTGQRQLFLDDYGVAGMDNLRRTMHQPEKRGAVIRPDLSTENALQTRCAPAWDPKAKRFKIWLFGGGETSYAESEDGVNWTKPVLRQKEIKGSMENNIVTVDPDLEWGANAIENVVFDPDDDDDSRRFKGLLGIDGRQPIVSPDGIHWERLDVPALPSSDESNLSYDRDNGIFIATLKTGGPYGRSHNIFISRNFEAWSSIEAIFHADDLDQRLGAENIKALLADPAFHHPPTMDPASSRVDVYNFGVARYEGLYLGFPAMFHRNRSDRIDGDMGFHLVQLASSRDLRSWNRLGGRKPFIGPSTLASGAYDRCQILPPSGPIIRDDELWFYYTGIKYRHPPERGSDFGAVCLAVLRRDGFISLDATEKEGTLLTQPFTAPEGRLFVNTDATEGKLRAEVLDENGKPIAKGIPVKGDRPRGKVQWETDSATDFKGKTIRIRFTLRNAAFYSYWFEGG
jgi:hypothetical protein